ncbi:MAG TPA: hypothetical protein VN205_07480 [Thermomonas sp.]|nr:hypothetical protein [Thermomonas sp.]
MRPFIWGGAACLLLLPAVAMQWFPASGVNWTASDFVVMGALFAVGCGIYELGAWLSGNAAYRAGFGLGALAGFLTIWVNLAVGMLGDEASGFNAMFIGVLAIAALGAILARMRPAGMARAMFATAAAQLAVVGIAVALGGYRAHELALTACFALPWLAAGQLFRSASQARNHDAATG